VGEDPGHSGPPLRDPDQTSWGARLGATKIVFPGYPQLRSSRVHSYMAGRKEVSDQRKKKKKVVNT